ncbi:MAG: DUF2177 family protein [Chloroflexota bacterium]
MISYYIKLYLATLAAFFAIDMVWLGLVARWFYSKYLGDLLRPQVNWAAAIAFYLLFIVGLLIFAVAPGLQANSLGKALLLGALFGFMTYATYDLTNLATLKNWPLIVTIVDLIWGTTLATLVTLASFLAGRWLR